MADLKLANEHLEQAQLALEHFLESHGATFNEEQGTFVFPVASQTAEYRGLVEATKRINDAQEIIET